jgi:hypothetical protein
MMEYLDSVVPAMCIGVSVAALLCIAVASWRFYFGTTDGTQERQRQNRAAGDHGEASNDSGHGDPTSIALRAFVDEYRANEEQNSGRENRRFYIECAALIIAAIYAGITFCLWRSAESTLTATQETVLLGRRYNEVNNGAIIAPNLFVDGFSFMPGQHTRPALSLVNIGKSRASRVAVLADVKIMPKTDAQTFHLACRQKVTPESEIFSKEDWWALQNFPTHDQWGINYLGIDKDIWQPHAAELRDGRWRLQEWVLAIYYNGFCLRCMALCRQFHPLSDQSEPLGRIGGGVSLCTGPNGEDMRPDCSRWGDDYGETGCLQTDISDRLGYYPESDDARWKESPDRCGLDLPTPTPGTG